MTALPGPGPAPRRRGLSIVLLLMASVVLVSVAEVAVILQAGRLVGPWWTLLLLVVTGFVGAWLLRREGVRAWRALVKAFESGRFPTGELADAALVLVGGVLLMLPGLLSDIVGMFFLIPFTRPLARRLVAAVVSRTASNHGVNLGALRARTQPDSVIKGETVEDVREPQSDPIVLKGELDR